MTWAEIEPDEACPDCGIEGEHADNCPSNPENW